MISIDAISFTEFTFLMFLFGFLVGITYQDWKLRKAQEK